MKIFLPLLFSISTNTFGQGKDCKPVQELKLLYKKNKNFRNTVDSMFENIHLLKDGSPNPWQNKRVEDLYVFLNEWFYFLPNVRNGVDRILQFTFLYYKNEFGKKFILEEPGKSWSLSFIEERGKYLDSPASAKIIREWMDAPSLNNAEFVYPREGFHSFNDFFTRNVKPGTRPIDKIEDNSILVSPADGIINMIANDLAVETQIPTKSGMTLNLNALLDNSEYVGKFIGGTALAVFLMPHNYHHYHAPISGTLVESKQSVGDRLFGMPDMLDMINNGNIAYNKDYSVFENFKHGYFVIQTEIGYIGMIPIGLQTVGSVVFEDRFKDVRKDHQVNVSKGERLGHFKYGGSTVLLIFEKGIFTAQSVRQGQQIGVVQK